MNLLSRLVSIFISSVISIVATFFILTIYSNEQKSIEKVVNIEDMNVTELVKNYQRSVIHIGVELDGLEEIEYIGTGFLINVDEENYILTNEHVISGANSIYASVNDEEEYMLEIVGKDYDLDLALLKFEKEKPKNITTLPFADSSELNIGEKVIAIGFPLDAGFSVTTGIISGLNKSFYIDDRLYEKLIQTDAAINPGNSGGPLINSKGEVIGINVAVSEETQGIAYTIPINTVKTVLNPFIDVGFVDRPFIGVEIFETNDAVEIANVIENSPAALAGLKKGDLIIGIDDFSINNFIELKEIINTKTIGESFELTFLRNNNKMTIDVVVGNRELVENHHVN